MNEKALNAQTQAAMTEAWAMARIGDFKETVAARVQDDLTFAQALPGKAITLFVNRGGSRRITGGYGGYGYGPPAPTRLYYTDTDARIRR